MQMVWSQARGALETLSAAAQGLVVSPFISLASKQPVKMCRLDFGSVASAPDQHQQTSDEAVGGDDAVEALLALACDTGMDYGQEELVVAAQHAHAAYSADQPSTASTSAAGGAGKASAAANDASSRYHCPFPGCKRSFAELWRLKVHYRCVGGVRQEEILGGKIWGVWVGG